MALIDAWKCRCRPFPGVRLELRLDHERNTYEQNKIRRNSRVATAAVTGWLLPWSHRRYPGPQNAARNRHGETTGEATKGPKDGKGKKGGYRKGGKIILVLEEYCAKHLFYQLAYALGAPMGLKKNGKKKGKKNGKKNGTKNGTKNGKNGGPKGYKGGPKGPKGGPYGYKASRGSARTRRG